MQYPVFPFVLADYSATILDLADGNSYRDLSKPIAVQNKDKVDRYIQNYAYLNEEKERCVWEKENSLSLCPNII